MNNVPASTLERIRRCMVGLPMPRAPDALNATSARFEQGDSSMLEVPGGGVHTRETRRITMALQTARLGTIRTLAGYDVRFLARNSLLVVDEIEYLPVGLNGGNLFI